MWKWSPGAWSKLSRGSGHQVHEVSFHVEVVTRCMEQAFTWKWSPGAWSKLSRGSGHQVHGVSFHER